MHKILHYQLCHHLWTLGYSPPMIQEKYHYPNSFNLVRVMSIDQITASKFLAILFEVCYYIDNHLRS